MRSRLVLTLISMAVIIFLSFGIIVLQRTFFPFGGNLLPQPSGAGRSSVTSTYSVITQTMQKIAGQEMSNSSITQTQVLTLTTTVSSDSTTVIVTTETNLIRFDQMIPMPEFPYGSLIAVLSGIAALLLFAGMARKRH